MATGLTLQDKPSVIITDSGLGRSRHTRTVTTEVGHSEIIPYSALCFNHKEHRYYACGTYFEEGNCLYTCKYGTLFVVNLFSISNGT